MRPLSRCILTLKWLSVMHLVSAAPDYTFPNCVTGPLKDNLVCNSSADYLARAKALVANLTLTEIECNVIHNSCGVPRLGLAQYEWWSEALHGVAASPGVTFDPKLGTPFSSASQFPNGISLGATFDDELYSEIGAVITNETRAFNNFNRSGLTYYSPINVNPFRDPRWGRGQEVPGEDPLHISNFARALIPAVQGDDPLHLNLLATCKHYLAYDLENWNGNERYGFDAIVSSQDLVEYYLPSFKACIRDARGASLMTSYNAINGVPASTSSLFLETVARQRWGFDQYHSFVTSDCDAVANVYDSHHYDTSYASAAGQSINAGTDLDCGATYKTYLPDAIAQNITKEDTVRQAAVRLYATLVRLGYFDSAAGQPLRSLGWEAVNTPYARDLTYRAAVEGAVLLKNNGVLPLSPKKYKSVALVGPWANNTGLGGIYSGIAPHISTVLEGLRSTFKEVDYHFGTNISSNDTSKFAAALAAARKADVVIYAGGLDPTVEREGHDRTDLKWPGNQLSLITQLASVGKPLVVLQFGGGQVDDTQLKADNRVGAIVWPGYPGQSGGQAIADIISGKQAPAGRLPLTQYPASYADAVAMTNMNLRPGANNPGRTYKWYTGTPVYDFGHGLHYTTFKAALSGSAGQSMNIQQKMASGRGVPLDNIVFGSITATVRNTGKFTSDYVAALYVSSKNGPAPHPERELVAYQRLRGIRPGQSATADLALKMGAFARADVDGDVNLYPGEYTLTLDNPDTKLAQTTITLTGSTALIEKWSDILGNPGMKKVST